MLTNLTIRNFKHFKYVPIELGNPVVFIGPNNSGKTTALQALALWDIGVKRWNEKRLGKKTPEKRPGVTINRRDLIAVPVPNASALWRDLHVRDVQNSNGKPYTQNVRIEIVVEGVANGKLWTCGMEFDYANEESLYCRPLRVPDGNDAARMPVPKHVSEIQVAFLPPMSGLASNESRLDPGAINVRLGEGRTAEVLRNLCYQISNSPDGKKWKDLLERMLELFGVKLDVPDYIAERGEISMTYRNSRGVRLDLSSSGRGFQQTLLLLAYLYLNPASVLLLDEPDAHLEILRQRQIYDVLTKAAREQGSQIIAASHSEVVLNEAADRDVVVAFLGTPHRIDDRGVQLVKALKEIGFQDYYQAEQIGWVLYVEGSTDLAILRAFAEKLEHPAQRVLEKPFLRFIADQPQIARSHFHGLKEAKEDLVGYVLCDRLSRPFQNQNLSLRERMWKRKEIENYLCQPETLISYAAAFAREEAAGPLFAETESERTRATMQECIDDLVPRAAYRDPANIWWQNVKASDEFLDVLFEDFFKKLYLPNLMRKTDYHVLARHVSKEQLDPEIVEVLDDILALSKRGRPMLPPDEE